MAKHDWDKIKNEFILARSEALRPSLKSLASKYDVNLCYMRRKAAKGDWRLESKLFLSKFRQEQAQLLNKTVEELALESKQDIHLYPIGDKVSKADLAAWLGFHLTNYTTHAKNTKSAPEEYINKLAKPKGEQWKELEIVKGRGNKKYFVRVK